MDYTPPISHPILSYVPTPTIAELINHPLQCTDAALQAMITAGAEPKAAVAALHPWWVSLIQHLTGTGSLQAIPILTPEAFRAGACAPNSLVRVSGMIQDLWPPEWYAETVATSDGTVATGLFRDTIAHAASAQGQPALGGRVTAHLVHSPAASSWTKPDTAASTAASPAGGVKRGRGAAGTGDDATKRGRGDGPAAPGDTSLGDLQRFMPSPLDCEPGTSVLLRMYAEDPAVRVGSMVEAVAVYTKDADLAWPAAAIGMAAAQAEPGAMEVAMDVSMSEEMVAQNPSPQAVPRVHAVAWRRLPAAWPVLDQAVPAWHTADQAGVQAPVCEAEAASIMTSLPAAAGSGGGSVLDLRAKLVQQLARPLQGDELAAEFLLLCLISRVVRRTEALALGKISLNLFGLPDESSGVPEAATLCPADMLSRTGADVFRVLQELLPRVSAVPLCKPVLAKWAMVPVKDHAANRLQAGQLQLPAWTVQLWDECVLSAGEIRGAEVQRLQGMLRVAQDAVLPYDFEYHAVDMPVDMPVVVLSATRSLTPADVRIPVQASPAAAAAAPPAVSLPLQAVRQYLAAARSAAQELPAEVTAHVEQAMAEARAASPHLQEADLHRWLVLARLHAASCGHTQLTMESWATVQRLELARAARVAEYAAARQAHLARAEEVHTPPLHA